jgi:hypothetical protein
VKLDGLNRHIPHLWYQTFALPAPFCWRYLADLVLLVQTHFLFLAVKIQSSAEVLGHFAFAKAKLFSIHRYPVSVATNYRLIGIFETTEPIL